VTDLDFGVVDDVRVALCDVPPPGPWARHARCKNTPPELWFPARGDDTGLAKQICARCPVIDDCLAYALAAGQQLQGIWGGTSARERRTLRSSASRADTSTPDVAQIEAPADAAAVDADLYAVLEQLTAHPGQWARVAHYTNRGSAWSTASMLRTGRRRIPAGRWEFEGRASDNGSDVYARYLDAGEIAS